MLAYLSPLALSSCLALSLMLSSPSCVALSRAWRSLAAHRSLVLTIVSFLSCLALRLMLSSLPHASLSLVLGSLPHATLALSRAQLSLRLSSTPCFAFSHA